MVLGIASFPFHTYAMGINCFAPNRNVDVKEQQFDGWLTFREPSLLAAGILPENAILVGEKRKN
jgi:hypothetical protein